MRGFTGVNGDSKGYENDGLFVYWQSFWERSIDYFQYDQFFKLKLDSPHLILNNILVILDEDFLSDTSRNYFSKKIETLLSDNKGSKFLGEEQRLYVRLVKDSLSKEPFYLKKLCSKALSLFNEGKFLEHILSQLIQCLTSKKLNKNAHDLIERWTEFLIVEFLISGKYSKNFIKDFAEKILSGYVVDKKRNTLHSNFPHEISIEDFREEDGQYNKSEYQKQIKEMIDSLTPSDRINSLKSYFNRPLKVYKVIFPLWGIVGDEEFSLSDVTIYSPEKKRYIKKDPHWSKEFTFNLNLELFDNKPLVKDKNHKDKKHVFSNAIVTVNGVNIYPIDHEKIIDDAILKLETTLNLISFHKNLNEKIKIRRELYFILTEEGYPLRWTPDFAYTKKIDPWNSPNDRINAILLGTKTDDLFPFHAQREYIKTLDKVFNSQINPKIKDSFYYIMEAEKEENSAKKLLFSWISVEGVFADGNSSQEALKKRINWILDVVPYVVVSRLLSFSIPVTFYDKLTYSSENISEELKKKTKLNKKRPFSYDIKDDFLRYLPDIIDESNKYEDSEFPQLVKKLEEVYALYSDKNKFKDFVLRATKQIETDLRLIYYYRNSIVHRVFQKDPLISFYAMRAYWYCSMFLNYIMGLLESKKGSNGNLNRDDEQSAFERTLPIKIKMDVLIAKIESGQPIHNLIEEIFSISNK